jgi:hypothetical protein
MSNLDRPVYQKKPAAELGRDEEDEVCVKVETHMKTSPSRLDIISNGKVSHQITTSTVPFTNASQAYRCLTREDHKSIIKKLKKSYEKYPNDKRLGDTLLWEQESLERVYHGVMDHALRWMRERHRPVGDTTFFLVLGKQQEWNHLDKSAAKAAVDAVPASP